MKELLKEWSEREPERCRAYGPNEIGRAKDEQGYRVMFYAQWVYLTNTSDSLARLQIAVQQAIEARGLKWELSVHGGGKNIKWYYAAIHPRDPMEDESTESPAHALLAAYLAALQATSEGVAG